LPKLPVTSLRGIAGPAMRPASFADMDSAIAAGAGRRSPRRET
jgi:hypothetical protein